MKILYIWDSDYPWDVRAEKICSTLANAGHEVHLAARNTKRRVLKELIGNIIVHRLRNIKNKKIDDLLSFPFFASPVWLQFVNKLVKDEKIDTIIVRDLPLAITGIWIAKRNHIPCVFDMAENYVAMVQAIWKKRKFSGLNLIVRNPYFASIVEKYVFKKVDKFLVVVEESADFLREKKVEQSRIYIVGNTPTVEDIDAVMNNQNSEECNDELFKSHYVAIYTGGIQRGRGIQVVFEAIPKIVEKIPNFLFVIVGDGYATDQLKKMQNELSISKYVHWVGWVEHTKVYSYIKKSNVGLIPHFTSDHVNTTIPNKIFDYMAVGLPVIASDAPPMKRIIEEACSGKVFGSGNASELANAVIQIYSGDIPWGANGQNAFKNKYNWSFDTGRLLEAINIKREENHAK